MQTISADAKSFLEDDVELPDVDFKSRGRTFIVLGLPANVAKVVAAGKAVDRWLRANAAMQRKHKADEVALSKRLERDLRSFKQR